MLERLFVLFYHSRNVPCMVNSKGGSLIKDVVILMGGRVCVKKSVRQYAVTEIFPDFIWASDFFGPPKNPINLDSKKFSVCLKFILSFLHITRDNGHTRE